MEGEAMRRVELQWLARGSCRHPEYMTMRGASLCATDFPAMVGVIRHPERGIILFDTGYDPAFIEATRPFPERLYRWTTPVRISPELAWQAWLAEHGIAAGEIAAVVVSHFHGDHVAGIRNLAGSPIHCSAAGLTELRRPGRLRRVRQGLLAELVPAECDADCSFFEGAPVVALPADFAPFTEGADILGDGSLIAVPLPGHCKGHWGLAMRDQDDRAVLLAGDASWSIEAIRRCVPPPRLTTALLGETRTYRDTLASLHAALSNNRALAILPSHCPRAAAAYADGDAV